MPLGQKINAGKYVGTSPRHKGQKRSYEIIF